MNRHRFAVTCFATLSLVVTSGLARASATVDLIWADTGTDLLSLTSANTSSTYTLNIILTAGAGGSMGAGVSVNYGHVLPMLSVVQFRSITTPILLPVNLGAAINQSPYIDLINATIGPGSGIGLSAGQSAYLGTVTFHLDQPGSGSFEIIVGTDGPRGGDGVLDLAGKVIDSTTTFNSAWIVLGGGGSPVPEPTAALLFGLGAALIARHTRQR
jgi:hypothetical protein